MPEYTASQKRKYLGNVLRLNPIQQAAQIIRIRNQWLGKEPIGANSIEDLEKLAKLREAANKQIEEIRKLMWRQQPSSLLEMLGRVDVTKLPEMKTAVARMKQVIKNQAALQAMAQHPQQFTNLSNTLKRVVMLPPRESGTLKEGYLRQIIESPDLRKIKAAIWMIENEFPSVYAMEAEWFRSIQNLKGRNRPTTGTAAEEYESGFGSAGWLVWIAIVVGIRVVMAIVRNQ